MEGAAVWLTAPVGLPSYGNPATGGSARGLVRSLGGVRTGVAETTTDIGLTALIIAGGKKFSPAMARIWIQQLDKALSMSDAHRIMKEVMNSAEEWIDTYKSFNEFSAHWATLRNGIPLQARLMVEQVLWKKGGSYRALVSGFRPLG